MIIKKIVTGFVIQSFDTETNQFVSQEFIAGDENEYEDENGKALYSKDFPEIYSIYLPYKMYQPETMIDDIENIKNLMNSNSKEN